MSELHNKANLNSHEVSKAFLLISWKHNLDGNFSEVKHLHTPKRKSNPYRNKTLVCSLLSKRLREHMTSNRF